MSRTQNDTNYISHQATFQGCPKARKDPVVWKIFSPHQSYPTSSGKGGWHVSWLLRTTGMPGIKLPWPETLCSAPCSSPVLRALLLSLRKASTDNCFHVALYLLLQHFFIIHFSQNQSITKLLDTDPIIAQ